MGGRRCFFLLLGVLCLFACRGVRDEIPAPVQEPEPEPAEVSQVVLADATAAAGLEHWSPTFGVAVADLDNDGRDDLVIGNHSYVPTVFLQTEDGLFQDMSWLLDMQRTDLHGITPLDLDNDGDRDLVMACGGSDGIGEGCENHVLENLLADTGVLAFRNISAGSGMTRQAWRTRHFIPLASADGRRIDLFMTCLYRQGHDCIYFRHSLGAGIDYVADDSLGLNQAFNSEGLDVPFDFDRDGDTDLLIIGTFRTIIMERVDSGYVRNEQVLPVQHSVTCAAVGDLDNDGFDDLFLGRVAPRISNDFITASAERIHCVVRRHEDDEKDGLRFRIPGDYIDIDFIQHTPGFTIRDPDNIFIGSRARNPRSRQARITSAFAYGEPERINPGIYIWLGAAGYWRVEWVYADDDKEIRGKILAPGIHDLQRLQCEWRPPATIRDQVWMNNNGRGFTALDCPGLQHTGVTRCVVFCDLDNDGRLDVAGIRGGEPGQVNGEPFMLRNLGEACMDASLIMDGPEDDVFQADKLVWGFFNADGLPDLFMTNGYGLNPGHNGPYRLWVNRTENAGDFVILVLEGSGCNRDALGADVEVIDSDGRLLGYRRLGAGFNRAQSSLKVHVGLGANAGPVRVRIRWPGIPDWEVRDLQVNQVNRIRQ